MLKENILSLLNMSDVLNKYNIKIRNNMCSCPFHKDKNPSMKIYDKSFYCFSCNRTGDIIQFVQYLFNLSFVDAMKKINYDFNLNLKCSLSKEEKKHFKKIQEKLEKEKLYKKQLENRKKNKFILYANLYLLLKRQVDKINKTITYENWEEQTEIISNLQNKMEILNMKMDLLY